MNAVRSEKNKSHRKSLILIGGIVVVLATLYVIKHREHRLVVAASGAPQHQARVVADSASAAHSSAAATSASTGHGAKVASRTDNTSLPLVVPSPTATGPETGKILQTNAAGVKRRLKQYDPNAAEDIPIVMDVMYGRANKLSERIDAGLNPNMTVPIGPTPETRESLLNFAISTGQRTVIRELLSRGASTAIGSPLIQAVAFGEVDVAKMLLDHGANPNKTGVTGTALSEAIIMGDYSAVKLLLKAGADPNQIGGGVRNYMNRSTKPTFVAIRKLVNGG